MPTAKLTSKGQITIPKAVRDRLGVDAGDHLEFRFLDDGSLQVARVSGSLASLRCALTAPESRRLSLDDIDRYAHASETDP